VTFAFSIFALAYPRRVRVDARIGTKSLCLVRGPARGVSDGQARTNALRDLRLVAPLLTADVARFMR
jgi:hypothetical protein